MSTDKLIKLLKLHSPSAYILHSLHLSIYGDSLHSPLVTINDSLNPSEGDRYVKIKIMAEGIIHTCQLVWTVFRLIAVMGYIPTKPI